MIHNTPPPAPRQGWLDAMMASPNKLGALVVLYCAGAGAILVLIPAPWWYIGSAMAVLVLAGGLRWLALWTAVGDTAAAVIGDWQISLNKGLWDVHHVPSVTDGHSAEPARTYTYWTYRQARRAITSGRLAAGLEAQEALAGAADLASPGHGRPSSAGPRK